MKFIIDTRDFHLFLFFTFVLLRLQTQNFILLGKWFYPLWIMPWKILTPTKIGKSQGLFYNPKTYHTHTKVRSDISFSYTVNVRWIIIKNCLLVISFQLGLWTDCLWWLKTGRWNLHHRLQKRFWSYPLHSDDFKRRNK